MLLLAQYTEENGIGLGKIFDKVKINAEDYSDVIEKIAKTSLGDVLDGDRLSVEKLSQAIGTSDGIILDYAQTLKDTNGNIDLTAASTEGLSAYLEKSGNMFNFAAIKATLFNAALNAGIMLLASFAVDWIIKGLDAINLTVEEQTEKVNELKASYEGLQSEYDTLSQKQDITDAEKRRLEYLERRLELDERILKAEQHQLFEEKTGNKFTDRFDEDNYNTQYRNETKSNKWNPLSGLSKNKESYDYLSKLYSKKMKDIEITQEQIAEWTKYRDAVAEGSNEWNAYQSHIDDAQNRQTDAMKDLEDSADKMTVNLGKYADNIEYFEERLASGDLNEEDTVIAEKQLNNWRELYESTEKMLDEIQKLNGTYDDTQDRISQSIRTISDNHGISDRNQYAELIEYTKDFTDEEKQLWLESTKGAENATQAIEMYEAALVKAQQTASQLDNQPLSISQTVDQLNTQLKPAMDSLKSAWQEIFTEDGFELDSIDILSTCDAIKSKLDEMSDPEGLNLDVDYSAFEDFVTVLNSTESTEQDVEKAFDSLATSITQAALSGAEDFETMKTALEDLGVVNNDIIAFQALINNTTALEEAVSNAGLTMDDFVVHTEDGAIIASEAAMAFIEEMVGAENCSQALALLQLQQMLCNENSLDTTDDINACLALANAAGVAVEALSWLAKVSAQYDAAVASGDTVAQKNLSATMQSIKAKINAEISNFEPVAIDFSGVGKGAKSAGKKAGKDYKDALKEELSDLDKVISGITGRIDDNIDAVKTQKEAALESIDAQIDALNEQKSVLEAQKKALEDARDAAVEALEEERDARIEVIEQQQKQLEQQIKLIDKQIKDKERIIKSINEEIDAMQDANAERQRQIDLQKAMYELERLQHQRTKLVYSAEKGMHYVNDTKGARDAKEKVDQAKLEIEIANKQKQIDLIEKEIDLLNEKKDAINEQIDLLDEQIDRINEYYDKEIEKVEKFYNEQIKAIDAQIESIDKQIEQIQKQREETEKYYESLIENLEKSKTKYQELTEILEKAELSAKLKQLNIDEEALLNGSEEEFEKLKNAYMDVVFQLNKGNDDVLNALRDLSGYEGTAPAVLEESNTKLSTMNDELGTANQEVSNVNTSLGETASVTDTVATNVGTVVDGLNQMPDSSKISGLAKEFDTLAESIGKVAESLGVGEGQTVGTLFQAMDSLNTVTLGSEAEGAIGQFTLLKNAITDVIETIGSSEEQTVGSLMSAIAQLNSISLDESIITQFTNLKEAIDSVTAAISGGGSGSSEGEGSGGNSGSKGGKSGGSGGKGSEGESGSGNSLTGAITEMGNKAKEIIGEPGAEGDGTVIGEFGSMETAVNDVRDAIGIEGTEGAKASGNENKDTLIDSIVNLGDTTQEEMGEQDGDGILGKFNEFKGVIEEAANQVKSISDGLEEIDGKEVECTITVNVKMNGSFPQFASGTVLGNMQIESATYNAKYGKAFASGTIGLKHDEKNALRSEYGQPELTVYPNGTTELTTSPVMSDLPKGTVIYNEEETKKIMDNKSKPVGNAHTDGTGTTEGHRDDGFISLMEYIQMLRERSGNHSKQGVDSQFYPDGKVYEKLEKTVTDVEQTLEDMKAPTHIVAENMKRFMGINADGGNTSNISNIVNNNRNVQQPVTVNQNVTLNCPNLTNNSGVEYVQKELGHLSLKAYQEPLRDY